jgi:hypothetical protein
MAWLSSAVGATLGYLIGKRIKKEAWEEIPLNQIQLGLNLDAQKTLRLKMTLRL